MKIELEELTHRGKLYLLFKVSGKTIFPKWMAFTNVIVIYEALQVIKELFPDSPFRLGFTNELMSKSMFI